MTGGCTAATPEPRGADRESGGNVLLVERDRIGAATETFLLDGGLSVDQHVRLVGGPRARSAAIVDELLAVRSLVAGSCPQLARRVARVSQGERMFGS